MSDLTNLDNARDTLRRLIVAALDSNRALYEGLQNPQSDPPNDRRAVFNRSLENLTQTREGFTLALRTSDLKIASELRDLISTILVDWSWLSTLGLRWTTDDPLENLGGQVILYQHALIAMRVLPTLPANAVTYPYGHYSDIPVPTTPGETLSRLQELEQTIWKAGHEPMAALPRGAVRRTYGFFEATTWLIATYLQDVLH